MSRPAGAYNTQTIVQPLTGLGPQVGEVWRNRHSRQLSTILAIGTRRKTWVFLRVGGDERELQLAELLEHWELTSLSSGDGRDDGFPPY